MSAQHAPGPTVDDLQRELLAICKGRDNYETWAKVTGQPVNERINEVNRIGKRAAVHDLRLKIHALNPNAALYFGWAFEDGPTAKREFFSALPSSALTLTPAMRTEAAAFAAATCLDGESLEQAEVI